MVKEVIRKLSSTYWDTVMICFCLALFTTMVSYPGIMYTDSYGRIDLARELIAKFKMLLSGQQISSTNAWLTYVPSFFIAFCIGVTGNVAFYTFLQAFVYYFLTFIMIDRLTEKGKILHRMLYIINPIFLAEGVFYEPAIGCICGSMLIILLLESGIGEMSGYVFGVLTGLLALAVMVAIGYRANAITILPAVILVILKKGWRYRRKIISSVSVLIGLSVILILPGIFKINTMSSVSAGWVWEMLSTIQDMEPDTKQIYIDYLDDIGGEGATAQALGKNNVDSVNGFLWDTGLNTYNLSFGPNPVNILRRYIKLALRESDIFIKNKVEFSLRTLGIGTPLLNSRLPYDSQNKMGSYGFSDSWHRRRLVDIYNGFLDRMSLFRRPWAMFILTLFLMLVWRKKASPVNYAKRYDMMRDMYLMAVFYYVAFLINTQSFEFRYFFPAFWMLLMIDTSVLADVFHRNR